MTIEATVQVELENESYVLIVKMIRVEPASYFFIRDKGDEKALLSGKTLELTFVDSFALTEFGAVIKTPGINKNVQEAIQKALLNNNETWLLPGNLMPDNIKRSNYAG